MNIKTIAIAVVLVACASVASADEERAEPKIYVSTDLLGIVMGTYQLSIETPMTQNSSLIAEGYYYNLKYGVRPKLTELYIGFYDLMIGTNYLSYTASFFDALELYGSGGTIGLARYFNKKGPMTTYFASSLSYSYYHLCLDMDSLITSPDVYDQPLGSIDIPIHIGSIAGRIGAKLHLGPVAMDLFYMLSLNGICLDSVEMYRSLGIDDQTIDTMKRLYLSLDSIALVPTGGLGFRFSLAF